MTVINNSMNDKPSCGVCGAREELVFRFHQHGDASYFFCWECSHVPQTALWKENGYFFDWVEPEIHQVRLV